jgi:beta-glucosidase/6-phospho-beta-glucosidase/beta-galactosidase
MFQSFFIGGFECSTHLGRHGNRHDLVASTGHDIFARADFRRLRELGITTAREGLRWHLIESVPQRYDFSSVLPIIRAARTEGIQVIWDLFHYGFPTDLNPFEQNFINRFAQFSQAFANFLKEEIDEAPIICPFNEVSFYSYAAGERGFFAPYFTERGGELKRNCVRAAIAATEAFSRVLPDARFAQIDPLVNIKSLPERPWDAEKAERYRTAQYEAYDMIAGWLHPELGGKESLLDVIGVNYYRYNQWFLAEDPTAPGITIHPDDDHYRPFHEILQEIYQRYERPLFVAETGAENEDRAGWLRYICTEVRTAIKLGVPISGICWYPILNHPGWDDDRHCHNGLWDYCDSKGHRDVYEPLEAELKLQIEIFERDRLSLGLAAADFAKHGERYSEASAF